MKTGNLLLGLITCAAMCACTDNDAIDGGGSNQVFTSNVAYMVVNICDVGTTGTRATDKGYVYGNSNEYAIHKANFYFYDENGSFVGKSDDVSIGIDEIYPNGYDNNIDIISTKVVAISNLYNKNYAKYVVTVLNAPEGFTCPNNLSGFEKLLSNETGVGIFENEGTITTDYLTMSTSSYYENTSTVGTANSTVHDKYYFATPVDATNFTTQPIKNDDVTGELTCDPVSIHVERLAAKVEVKTDLVAATDMSEGVTGTYYKLPEQQTFILSDGDEGDYNTESQDVYIKFDGWALNATAKHSYMMKYITTWDNSDLGFTWNVSAYWRSHWCESYTYLQESNITSAKDIDESKDLVSYISANEINHTIGTDDVEYCAENTNTAGVIQSKNSSAITSVLLKATVCDKDSIPMDIVNIGNGMLFTTEHYLNYALSHMGGMIGVYDSENDNYHPVSTDYLELAKNYVGDTEYPTDGYVKVVLSKDYKNITFYELDPSSYVAETNSAELTNPEVTYDATAFQEILDENFNNVYGTEANAYTDGLMYYNIPIEHMNNPAGEPIEEGMYGVVRNHYYVLNISELTGLGWGIFDPTEDIIPQSGTDTYYIGAKVDVLSWEMLEQDVKL